MDENLLQIFQQLESVKEKYLKLIDGLDNETLNLKPERKKWSIAQILFHVIKGEQYVLISLLNSLKPETKIKTVGFSASIKSFVLNFLLKTNFKFKAPDTAQKVPNAVNTEELLNKWDEIRIKLKEACVNMPKNNYNKGIFKHPYIGMINLNQSLQFLLFHLNHHVKQISDLSTSLKQK